MCNNFGFAFIRQSNPFIRNTVIVIARSAAVTSIASYSRITVKSITLERRNIQLVTIIINVIGTPCLITLLAHLNMLMLK